MARPTILTVDLINELGRGVSVGMTYELACTRAGVDYKTYRRWAQGHFPRSVNQDVRDLFYEVVQKAESQAVFEALTTIKAHSVRAIPGQWTAAAWLLERRYPESYGRRAVEVSGPKGGPVEHAMTIMDLAARVAERESISHEEAVDDAMALIREHQQ